MTIAHLISSLIAPLIPKRVSPPTPTNGRTNGRTGEALPLERAHDTYVTRAADA